MSQFLVPVPVRDCVGPAHLFVRCARPRHHVCVPNPFGNLAAGGDPKWIVVGPWLCVPTFRWVCLFEDSKRGGRPARKRTLQAACIKTVARKMRPVKSVVSNISGYAEAEIRLAQPLNGLKPKE